MVRGPWIKAIRGKTAWIEQERSLENGCLEIITARFRDERLNGEVSYSLRETQI